jgi:D-alanine-D-alanine ligase
VALTSKKIGVLMGGYSTEKEISMKSGQAIEESLRRQGCRVVGISVERDVAERIRGEAIDLAVIALHGRGGEDGAIQGLLEVLGVPYTGSGILASAIGMNKAMTKRLLQYYGLPTPEYTVLRSPDGIIDPPAGFQFPLVIKPASEGSTVGVSIVRGPRELVPALNEGFKYDSRVLLEEYIAGREITGGILDHEPLPLVEIIPKESFYDYRAKYTAGMTEYIVPAGLSSEQTEEIRQLALKVYEAVGCEGCARVDFRLTEKDQPYILEINTVPGMTETSLLPKAAQAAGMEYDALVGRIVRGALERAGTA